MNEYTAGDLVEAVKGETVIRGRLTREGLHLWVGDSGRTPENIESYGFTISIIEKAAAIVVLPTEPGAIIRWETPYFTGLAMLEKTDQWCCDGLLYNNKELLHKMATQPFTPLAPVSETAEKVIQYLEDQGCIDERDSYCGGVRAHFGVTA